MAAGLYKLFLVKIGKGDPRDDVARAAAVKQALGDRARVHVDINQSWNETTAVWASVDGRHCQAMRAASGKINNDPGQDSSLAVKLGSIRSSSYPWRRLACFKHLVIIQIWVRCRQ